MPACGFFVLLPASALDPGRTDKLTEKVSTTIKSLRVRDVMAAELMPTAVDRVRAHSLTLWNTLAGVLFRGRAALRQHPRLKKQGAPTGRPDAELHGPTCHDTVKPGPKQRHNGSSVPLKSLTPVAEAHQRQIEDSRVISASSPASEPTSP